MVVGICCLDLRISENNSLKGKRRILKRIIERVKHKFNVSIAEVGNHDLWQSSQIGFCMVGNDKRFINSALDKIIYFIEEINIAEITKSDFEIINL
ncbi:MAG: DUF503 family protein [Deltaproteobacteria bacterium]|nr:DUF503 domain-containing protein [Deltaproteobacteria bacterium]NOQ85605.1 DUF503 family protein [Deltaproteobacteria bacterium]